jgi:hypothetical protein
VIADQPDRFDDLARLEPMAHVPMPRHVINRFIEFHDQMSKAETWPWEEDQVETLKTRTWSCLLTSA